MCNYYYCMFLKARCCKLILAILICQMWFTVVGSKVLPNFVIVLTDDQDSEMFGMFPMEKTRRLLGEHGATYRNAYTTTPVCCPSRSSILSGLYLHNHEVLNNSISGGCSSLDWQQTHEPVTFASKLQKLGYTTFYAGKYLNQYGSRRVGGIKHIPPGWNQWIGLAGNSKYFNYTVSFNGRKMYFKDIYLTRLLQYLAKRFINYHHKETNPFLMIIAPPAPHAPFTAEPEYEDVYKDAKIPRTIQFNNGQNELRHWLVRMGPSRLSENTIKNLDSYFGKRWETLLSVDDLVQTVVGSLTKNDLIEDTYIVYTSDNGFHLGQFAMPFDKRMPYEFDIKVPLIVRGPGIPKNISVYAPALLIDIAPTILKLVGLKTDHLDGKSLIQVLTDHARAFLIEYYGEKSLFPRTGLCWPHDGNVLGCSKGLECKCQDSRNNTYTCLKVMDSTTHIIFCKFVDDEDFEEAYDLKQDPYQMTNIAYALKRKCKSRLLAIMRKLSHCRGLDCQYFDFKAFDLMPNCFIQ